MNKQTGKQFGETNPAGILDDIMIRTLNTVERKYNTAFPVSGDVPRRAEDFMTDREPFPVRLTSVATGAGPFPISGHIERVLLDSLNAREGRTQGNPDPSPYFLETIRRRKIKLSATYGRNADA